MIYKSLASAVFFLSLFNNSNANNIDMLRNKSDFEFTINYSREPVSVDVDITEPIEQPKDGTVLHKVVYFDKSNLVKFFDNQKNKNIIFVNLCLFSGTAEEEVKYLDEWVIFLRERGYKRVIIARNGTFGSNVLRDVVIP